MVNRRNNREVAGGGRDLNASRTESRSSTPNDLPDSEADREKLQPEETTIDLPDVSDIPGQENITVPPLGELADTTISSADEEGEGIFEDEDRDLELRMGTSADISNDERRILADTEHMPATDADNLRNARMDNVDFDGERLNERSFGEEKTGKDLDVPGASADNLNEEIGEEDEENNEYSLGGR